MSHVEWRQEIGGGLVGKDFSRRGEEEWKTTQSHCIQV